MVKLAFITGITGQDGSYLAELLLEKNYKIYGIVRRTSIIYSYTRLNHIYDKLHLEYGDMSVGSSLSHFISKILRENQNFEKFEIYNLAAQSHVKISFDIPEYTTLVDGLGTLKLLEIIRGFPEDILKKVRFYQAGSSEMFGKILESPQNETTPFNPQSPYATAKLLSHYTVKNYRDGYGIFACNGILFNHESPRRGANFVTMKIINEIKKIQNGESEYITLGNLNSKRDWGHAKDYVKGMWLMLQQETPDDYILATGKTTSVREFVEKCFLKIGKEIVWGGEGLDEIGKEKHTDKILVKIDKKYFRPNEVDFLLGNSNKAKKKLGWIQEYNLELLIDDMFENHVMFKN